jgi:hypothetical protein
MAQLRAKLHSNAEGLARNAETLMDWRYHVRQHPWLTLAVAGAVGYLVVPRRLETIRPDAAALAELARRQQLVVEPKLRAEPRSGLLASVVGLASSALLRAAAAYAGQQVGRLFTGPQDAQAGNGHASAKPR